MLKITLTSNHQKIVRKKLKILKFPTLALQIKTTPNSLHALDRDGEFLDREERAK